MNRSIKFRAYDREGAKMSSPFKIEELKFGYLAEINNSIIDSDVVLMQFTGLLDKNGKEIYEGDILNYGNYSDNKKPANFIVVWDDKGAEFAEKEIRKLKGGRRLTSFDNCGDVIGNIYENPELRSSLK